MQPRALWRISVRTTAEAEEAIAELLEAQFGRSAVSYTNAESGATHASVFLAAAPAWPAVRRQLRAAIRELGGYGLNTGPAQVALARVAPQDWAESWKRHFKPFAIGSRLLIRPSWSKRQPRGRQTLVVLDPGLSFGTGHHPTTRFCLRQLAARRRLHEPQSFLDVGTGSGILAIAAASLGYRPVEAVEADREALAVARRNAAVNKVARKIRFLLRDLNRISPRSSPKYSIVCANLTSNLLIAQRQKLVNRLDPKGVLIAAGILATEFGAVRQAFRAAGLEVMTSRAEGEWKSGAFGFRKLACCGSKNRYSGRPW